MKKYSRPINAPYALFTFPNAFLQQKVWLGKLFFVTRDHQSWFGHGQIELLLLSRVSSPSLRPLTAGRILGTTTTNGDHKKGWEFTPGNESVASINQWIIPWFSYSCTRVLLPTDLNNYSWKIVHFPSIPVRRSLYPDPRAPLGPWPPRSSDSTGGTRSTWTRVLSMPGNK